MINPNYITHLDNVVRIIIVWSVERNLNFYATVCGAVIEEVDRCGWQRSESAKYEKEHKAIAICCGIIGILVFLGKQEILTLKNGANC